MRRNLLNLALCVLTMTLPVAALAQSQTQADDVIAPAAPAPAPMKGYDFEHIVDQWERSLTPLRHELGRKSDDFVRTVERATALLEQDRQREAIDMVVGVIEQVLVVRDRVLEPMWQGQAQFDEQVATIRLRLAEAAPEGAVVTLDKATESLLDDIAGQITKETDGVRRRRLTIRYKTMRVLAEIRQTARTLPPDQRKLWEQVLDVLEESALVHLSVLVRTEVMFAQLDAAAHNLRDMHTLYTTTRGAVELMRHVSQAGQMRNRTAALTKQVDATQLELSEGVRKLMARLEADLEAK